MTTAPYISQNTQVRTPFSVECTSYATPATVATARGSLPNLRKQVQRERRYPHARLRVIPGPGGGGLMPAPCPPGCGCGKHNSKSATAGPPCAVCGAPTGAQNKTGVCRRTKACRAAYHQLRTSEQRKAEYQHNRDYYTERNYRAQHGLTLADYEEMPAAQDGRCAICGTDRPGGKHGKRFHIDHDHSCCPKGKTCEKCRRELLCANCNVGLGALGDDPDRLLAAAAYLISHGKGAAR